MSDRIFDELDELKLKSRHGIELTSMIDIIFILLIFFMVSTTFSKIGVAITIPESKYVSQTNPMVVDIFIDIDGLVYFEDEFIEDSFLTQLVRRKIQKDPKTLFVLNPDKDTVTQDLLRVLDLCKDAEATQFSIAAKRKP